MKRMVGAAGFEPTTPCPPDKCATGLRYAPTMTVLGGFQSISKPTLACFVAKQTEANLS